MISPFGVDHGEISKGALASDLKFFAGMAKPANLTSQTHLNQLRKVKTKTMLKPLGAKQVSKALKPQHVAALKRVKQDRSLKNWRKASYAGDRLSLHGFKDLGDGKHKGPLPIMSGHHHSMMDMNTRVRRSVRDTNRKGIFG